MSRKRTSLTIAALTALSTAAAFGQVDTPAAAQRFGASRAAVQIQPDGLYICEAEEFKLTGDRDAKGWRARRFGENYYAATFANSFLSRKAFLGAPEQSADSTATLQVDIEEAGRYLVLARYEAAYRFERQFRFQVEQGGRRVFDRLYGARDNIKIWAFSQKLKKEVGWSWGAVENVVWEGHDSFVNLKPGRAVIRLIAGEQSEPAAKRNVDLVMLTTDVEQVKMRIEKERYLPLDGMLTQSGDVYLRVTNHSAAPLTFTGKKAPTGGNWQQHSPYWVHIRNWEAPTIEVAPSKRSDWVEVGSTMDSLADGQWFWTGNGEYTAEFGWKNGRGQIESLATFRGAGDLNLAADADTRYSRRLRRQEEVLYDLLSYLKRENPAPHGRLPQRTPIFASTFTPLDEGKHAAAVTEFRRLFGLSDNIRNSATRTYIDVRNVRTPQLESYLKNLGATARHIQVVSLGDEISLPTPRGEQAVEQMRAWLRSQGLRPADIDPAAGGDWKKISYNIDPASRDSEPGVYYWSKRYQHHFGVQTIKQRTDLLRRHLPNAAIGANYSPHYPQEHMFLGEVFKWVSVFRASGMTLPWSEDYIWQVPIGTPQMNNINLDLFRAGLRHHPDRKIMYYVMPHMPNNTPAQWRRLFYGAVGHGMKMVNLFEFRPVHVAYTENHVDDPRMYKMVLGSFRELGLFEDIVQDGTVRPAEAALWFSETGDIWGDSQGSFAAAKRALYTAIRHQQTPLDFVVEQDAVDGTLAKYKVLYLTDAHVSSAASAKIAAWVERGGILFGTAGAGMFDELNRPNATLRKLFGVEQTALEAPADKQITWLKQDMPFAQRINGVANLRADTAEYAPIYCVRSKIKLTTAKAEEAFEDNLISIAINETGRGRAIFCAYLPSLSYYAPAIPKRPVDRGATDDSMVHFLPTKFDEAATEIIRLPINQLQPPVRSSAPLVESTIINSKHGVVIPLVNWSGRSVKDLQLTLSIDLPAKKVSLASGGSVRTTDVDGARTLVFDLDEADALILR